MGKSLLFLETKHCFLPRGRRCFFQLGVFDLGVFDLGEGGVMSGARGEVNRLPMGG
jgi:hypothetical protein